MNKQDMQQLKTDAKLQINNLQSVSKQLQNAIEHANYLFKKDKDNWVAHTILDAKRLIDDTIAENN